MQTYPPVSVAVACNNILGEGPVWDYRTGTLFWIDIKGKTFETMKGDKELMTYPVSDMIGFLALTDDPDVLLLGLRTGFTLYRLSTKKETTWVHPEPMMDGETRLNDGKVDPAGRCVAGTMDLVTMSRPIGSLYTLSPSGAVRSHDATVGRVTISNGMEWSVEQPTIHHHHTSTMFYIDSPTRLVKKFGYDVGTGQTTGSGEVVHALEGEGVPDGCALDAEGFLWVAVWDGGRVVRIDTGSGKVVGVLPIPSRRPTAIAFGGDDLSTMYVTSARPNDPATEGPGGDVYEVRIPGVYGRKTNLFALKNVSKTL